MLKVGLYIHFLKDKDTGLNQTSHIQVEMSQPSEYWTMIGAVGGILASIVGGATALFMYKTWRSGQAVYDLEKNGFLEKKGKNVTVF